MKIQSVEGDDLVSGIRLAPDVQAQEINGEAGQQVNDFCPADGVFIAMGTAGSTEIARQMGAELTEKATLKLMKIWKQPSRDSMRQVTVQVDFFRWRKLYMREHRQVLMQGSM